MKDTLYFLDKFFIISRFIKIKIVFIAFFIISCSYIPPNEDQGFYYIDEEFAKDHTNQSELQKENKQRTEQKTINVENGWGYYTDEEKKSQTSIINTPAPAPPTLKNAKTVTNTEYGKASYYGTVFHGRPTASGELYDRGKLTAAHLKHPFGTICKVTNLANGKSVEVKINDRGPHVKSRIIDLSYKAMSMIDGINAGIIDVRLDILK